MLDHWCVIWATRGFYISLFIFFLSLYTKEAPMFKDTWPILWTRSSAWIRSPGVQDNSAKITVLAAVKVNPTPPALIDSCRHMNRNSLTQIEPYFSQNYSPRLQQFIPLLLLQNLFPETQWPIAVWKQQVYLHQSGCNPLFSSGNFEQFYETLPFQDEMHNI